MKPVWIRLRSAPESDLCSRGASEYGAMKRLLITGATGRQGGAVVEHLLSGEYGEYDLYGLTRDAESETARALTDRGVAVVEGDLTDGARMRDLLEGMDGAYLVTTFFEDGTDAEREQGVSFAEACADAGIGHLVFSSVGGADRSPLPHFRSKAAVEDRIAALGLPATVLRPVFFMQNFGMLHDEIREGRLPLPLADGVTLQVVDADDIGRTAAMAFADPDRFAGETVHLAGDELTLEGMAEAFADHLGHPVEAVHLDVEAYRAEAGDELADMYAWFNEGGYDEDFAASNAEYGIDATTLPEFLAASDTWRPTARPAR